MSSATPRPTRAHAYDPDHYRMTVGEHLEELRQRMIWALIGFVIAFVFCLVFARRVVMLFCRPLLQVLYEQNLNPQLFFTQMLDPFMVYIKISLITAAALASPWIFYQFWAFVAAGLYPHERRYVMRYLPLSIALLIAGMALVYFFVLRWALRFFIMFGTAFPLPAGYTAPETQLEPSPGFIQAVPVVAGDPVDPQPGQLWFNTIDQRLKIHLPPDRRQLDRRQAEPTPGTTRTLAFVSDDLLAPLPTLPEYINLVLLLLIVFGVCFQLPLVVLALERVGIIDIEAMRNGRKYVYFGLAVLSAVVTPADIISMIALMLPLILLYEFGILMAGWGRNGGPQPDEDTPPPNP